MRLLPLLLLFACSSFTPPDYPGAKQACIDWFAATREKAISCGVSAEQAEASYEQWTRTCEPVVWADTDMLYHTCIPRLMADACDVVQKDTCPAFVRFGS